MPYPEEMIAPMRAELADNGVTELKTQADVEAFMEANKTGTAMIVLNSVCGCAAGSARPGILKSLQAEVKPGAVGTSFAGNDSEAVNYVRGLAPDAPPSSPSVYLFKNGEASAYIPRHVFESGHPDQVADTLKDAYNNVCA
ncbi:MAG: BrxA/BrxB family bacilliredoxin [Planctomycetota bacterium]|jgi:putative YphP/YqiW family bacilliredoxin